MSSNVHTLPASAAEHSTGGPTPAAASELAEVSDDLDHAPPVQVALARVMAEVEAVGKNRTMDSAAGGYAYRSVDDVYDAVQGPLSKHGVIIVPDVARLERSERTNERNKTEHHVAVELRMRVIGPRGDAFEFTAHGEGTDRRDRCTQKAVTDADKYATLRLLRIRVTDAADEGPQPGGADRLEEPLVALAVRAARLAGAGIVTDGFADQLVAWARERPATRVESANERLDTAERSDDLDRQVTGGGPEPAASAAAQPHPPTRASTKPEPEPEGIAGFTGPDKAELHAAGIDRKMRADLAHAMTGGRTNADHALYQSERAAILTLARQITASERKVRYTESGNIEITDADGRTMNPW